VTNRYRSDVVGSLLRPAYLKEARQRHEAGVVGAAEFKKIEDRAVDEAVALQIRAGVDIVTDGEMRRDSFFGHMIDAVEGFDRVGGGGVKFRDEQGGEQLFRRPVVVSRLRRRRHMCAEEFTYLRARAERPAKATLVTASQAAAHYDADRSKGAYATMDAYLADIVGIIREEVEELIRLGCPYIQIDAPNYASLLDETIRERYKKRGIDPDRLLDQCIETDNAVIASKPGAIFALHVCRGNNQSKFFAAGGYDPIAAKIFRRSRFQRFLLEYDDARSGGFEPLKDLPDDRTVVLGLVTTKKAALEKKDDLKRRIREAEAFVPLERLALSPQCGFASVMEGNLLSPAEQEAKLWLVAETAREVWRGS
jgi:5-methyltetrahydropteroyltriglutamate--homocysteine methyltransferase